MSRAKIEANNERKKNYKQYNRKAKTRRVTIYIPIIVVAALLLAFLGFGGYTAYSSYKADNPTVETVNLDAISDYTSALQSSESETASTDNSMQSTGGVLGTEDANYVE